MGLTGSPVESGGSSSMAVEAEIISQVQVIGDAVCIYLQIAEMVLLLF